MAGGAHKTESGDKTAPAKQPPAAPRRRLAAKSSPAENAINQSPRVQAQLCLGEAMQRSARVTAQRALAAEINQASVAGGAAAPVTQRVIRTKTGGNYTRRDELPEEAQANDTLAGLAASGERYLALSAADVVKRAKGQEAPILTPHRHLIGEQHNASHFEEALTNWGWGADKMAEGFRASALVTDQITQENSSSPGVGLVTNPFYQTKALDNLHAAALHDTAMQRGYVSTVKELAEAMKACAEDVANDVNTTKNRETFSKGETAFDRSAGKVKNGWGVMNYLPSYKSACQQRLLTPRGGADDGPARLHDFATYMSTRWDRLEGNIKYLSERPYGRFDSWTETATKLGRYVANATDFLGFIDNFAGHLVKLAQAESATLPGDAATNRNAVSGGWAKAQSDINQVHEGGSEIREPFMANNINTNLNKPGIVQIGAQHVVNLNGKITDGKYHQSYDAFVTDTKT
jgi:hypothetical protein